MPNPTPLVQFRSRKKNKKTKVPLKGRGLSMYLPTEKKAWENSPCFLGARNGHVLPGNARWCWEAAKGRWSDPVPERYS